MLETIIDTLQRIVIAKKRVNVAYCTLFAAVGVECVMRGGGSGRIGEEVMMKLLRVVMAGVKRPRNIELYAGMMMVLFILVRIRAC